MNGSNDRLPPCVVFVHGINHDKHQFDPMARFLETQGIRVEGIDLSPSDGSKGLIVLADQVVDFLRSVVISRIIEARKGRPVLLNAPVPDQCRVHLCGFSMGGLVSRIAFQQRGASPYVKSLISLAAPHSGTIMAHLRQAKGVREMRPWSRLLWSLNSSIAEDAARNRSTHFTQIWTPWDYLIVPPFSGRLPVGRNVMLPVVGHNRLIESTACFAEVLRAIQQREAIREGFKVA